jgi:uroporphyrinogen III methyltransferase/synthase
MSNKGRVIIAGAGPGDEGLITVKALEYIRKCDVILYDKLANPELLNECKDNCEKIFVGKEAGLHHVTQDTTISILIEKALAGKLVLRLKGGDPLIFGRGSEEAMALNEKGIEFEIVPGITAGAGASAYAGIPLTHRNLVTQTVFVTAHESPDKSQSQVDWELLAQLNNTVIVIYMGAAMLPQISKKLIDFGMSPNTSVAVVRHGTLPNQKTIISTLDNIEQDIVRNSIKPPIITLIGPTIALREKLQWFETKPLFGKRIVATRAEDQAQSLYSKLKSDGAEVIPFKVIKTEIESNIPDMKNTLINPKTQRNNFDWLIFSSENGVRYFFKALNLQGYDARLLSNSKIAAIGTGTADALKKYYITVDFIPEKFTSEHFVKDFTEKFDLKSQNILRIKGDFENDIIADAMKNKGIALKSLVVYKLLADKPDPSIIDDLMKNGADAILFTSSSTVNHFFELFGNNTAKNLLTASKVFSIGPVTENTLKKLGINNIFVAETHTIDGLIKKLKENI